jgi:hypothetical protein
MKCTVICKIRKRAPIAGSMTSTAWPPAAILVITSNQDLVIFVELGGWNTIYGVASARKVTPLLLVMIVIGALPVVNNSNAY